VVAESFIQKEEEMRRIRILLFTLCLVLFYVTPAKAADALKVGFIDLQRIFAESDLGKKAAAERADIEATKKAKEAAIQEKINVLKKMEEEIVKQSSVLSADAKKAKEEEMEKLQKDVQGFIAEARAELQKKENSLTNLTNSILKDISDIVDAIGYEENYALILRSEALLSAKKELDLTGMVVKRLNEPKGKPKEEPKAKPKEKPKGKKKG